MFLSVARVSASFKLIPMFLKTRSIHLGVCPPFVIFPRLCACTQTILPPESKNFGFPKAALAAEPQRVEKPVFLPPVARRRSRRLGREAFFAPGSAASGRIAKNLVSSRSGGSSARFVSGVACPLHAPGGSYAGETECGLRTFARRRLHRRLPVAKPAASSYVADASARTTCGDRRFADDDWLPSLGRDGARFVRSLSGMRRPNVRTSGPVESDRCSYVKHSTVLLIPTPQRVFGRRTENSRACPHPSLVGGCAALSRLVVERLVDCLKGTTRAGRAS